MKSSPWFSIETQTLEYYVVVKVLAFQKKGSLNSTKQYLDFRHHFL